MAGARGSVGMAIDAVAACATSADEAGPRGFFVVLAVVFASYILADSVIAAAVIRKKAMWPEDR